VTFVVVWEKALNSIKKMSKEVKSQVYRWSYE